VRESFKVGFHYFFGVGFLSFEGNVTEKVFHEACVGIVKVFLWLLAVSCAPLLAYLADVFGGCGLLFSCRRSFYNSFP
jgi:hypothetical protein